MHPSEHPYTPLFCEENIWQLARRLLAEGTPPDDLWVLFFSNPDKQLVMLKQQRSGEYGYVVWDYHVVLQAADMIYDFDTTLQFPVNANDYLQQSFPNQRTLRERYRGWVRRIPARTFLTRFYSDRSHMHGVVNESEFPAWPPMIPSDDDAIALSDYWDMQKEMDDGSEVVSVAALVQRQGD